MNRVAIHIRSLFRAIKRRPRNKASFKELFDRFREVLDKNNKALEVITDMGDTLGGDYLFDIQYVRKSYAALYSAMEGSLNSIDSLTRNRYPRLRGSFLSIDERIRHVVEETISRSNDLVVFYEEVSGDRVRDIGGKNANLAEVRNAVKLGVPPAFAVTTQAFNVFMGHNRIFDKVQLPPDNAPLSKASLNELHELVLHGDIPPDLKKTIEKALSRIKSQCKGKCTLAVRSSAGEEDGENSFAGQFETVLNVPLEVTAVARAYQKVVASLYSEHASIYQARLGYNIKDMKMAVACVVMVDAAASGVIYSTNTQGDRNTLLINATWGLGSSLVEGRTDADSFVVKKNGSREIIEERIGRKDSMVIGREPGGVATVETPEKLSRQASLTKNQVAELAGMAQAIERHFRRPQDIEWAIDRQGEMFILQARPLLVPEENGHTAVPVENSADPGIVTKNKGLVVQQGAVAGRVFILKNHHELDSIPKGAILVAHSDSSHFVRVMTDISAIITDVGTLTSHMAALCREFKIPTVVNMGDATKTLVSGQEITIHADGNGATLYNGAVRELLERAKSGSAPMDALSEFRKKRYLLRFISPLNLIDPLKDDFTPEACKTMHDILRFIHEKSAVELIESAGYGVQAAATIKLELPIPAGIMLIDIGGGLQSPVHGKHAAVEDLTSLPFKAIVAGMIRPGIWRSDAVSLNVNDFMTSMLRAPSIDADSANHIAPNVAVISKEYVNLSLRFGYHFIVLDCFCGEHTRNNHIYFRFTGGATDMSKRSRRLQFIEVVLGEYGFAIKTKGDLLVARLSNIRQEDAAVILDQLGRLISYTRQLDAMLNDDGAVERFAKKFMNGEYAI